MQIIIGKIKYFQYGDVFEVRDHFDYWLKIIKNSRYVNTAIHYKMVSKFFRILSSDTKTDSKEAERRFDELTELQRIMSKQIEKGDNKYE